MMPEMDGYETARAIRSMPRFEHLPIISLTAKAILAHRASVSLGLAREHHPSAVLLAVEEPRFEAVLGQLKKHPDTRHLPVALVGDGAVRVDGLRAGAAAFIDDPIDPAGLDTALHAETAYELSPIPGGAYSPLAREHERVEA